MTVKKQPLDAATLRWCANEFALDLKRIDQFLAALHRDDSTTRNALCAQHRTLKTIVRRLRNRASRAERR